MDYKYYKEDKEISKKILKEFKGKVISHKCAVCCGTGKIGVGKHHEFVEPCYECGGSGKINIEW